MRTVSLIIAINILAPQYLQALDTFILGLFLVICVAIDIGHTVEYFYRWYKIFNK